MRRHQSLLTACVISSLAAFAAIVLPASQAHAHISLEMAGTHLSRSGDAATSLKGSPCGIEGSVRNTDPAHIYTYEPGQVVTLSVIETIPHPGYFRIAFDNDGDDGFVDPKSIKPIDTTRGCPCTLPGCSATSDHCDKDDFYNNATVLPGMDNLNPHTNAASGTKYTWQITMPNVECDNCTLQIIQVMEDPFGHGPYDDVSDVYHQCVEIVLKHGAGTGGAGSAAAGAGAAGAAGEAAGGAGFAGTGVAAAGAGAAGFNGGGAGVVANQTGNDTVGGAGAAGVSGAPLSSGGTPNNSTTTSSCSVGGEGAFTSLFAPIALSLLAPLLMRRRKRG